MSLRLHSTNFHLYSIYCSFVLSRLVLREFQSGNWLKEVFLIKSSLFSGWPNCSGVNHIISPVVETKKKFADVLNGNQPRTEQPYHNTRAGLDVDALAMRHH